MKLIHSDDTEKHHDIERKEGLDYVNDTFATSNDTLKAVLVYDLERDGNVGSTAVPVSIHIVATTLSTPFGLGKL